MMYFIVSVRDRAANAFGRPIFCLSLGQAIRSFSDEVNRAGEGNDMFRHPDDFDLYHLGMFEDMNGAMESLSEPKMLAIGKQVKIPGGV